MGRAGAALGWGAVVAAGLLSLSGGTWADPQSPPALPGLPPPFLGTAVVGTGESTAAIDSYGGVVDLRPAGPAGPATIDLPAERLAAGTVPAATGIVPRVRLGGRRALPLWRADSVRQRYHSGTNVLVTTARFGAARVRIVYAASGSRLVCLVEADDRVRVSMRVAEPATAARLRCNGRRADNAIRDAERRDRRWLRGAMLGTGAPAWAQEAHERSLLVLRALTDRRSGAVAAGARDGWAYVWPRDAAATALALAAAGYRTQARQVVRFLLGLDLDAAARFDGRGVPIPGRGPQGDATGWVAVAARAVGLEPPARGEWRDLPDYQETESGDFTSNALAAGAPAIKHLYGARSPAHLVREPAMPSSGLDSAAAWAVEPFSAPALHPAAGRTMLSLTRRGTRFGITPGTAWPGEDPWTAPTAWTAWSLAALGERRPALAVLADLSRAATPLGTLPERVDARTGAPRSTTPLAWSHAFTILALQELWPSRTASNFRPSR